MSQVDDKQSAKRKCRPSLKHSLPQPLVLSRIESLDEIPDYLDAETEARFWRTHCLSEDVFDQIPDVLEEQE